MTETGFDPAAVVSERMKDMTPDQAVRLVRELCAQLGGDAESFHGNIWPDNVRFDWEGKAVLGEPSNEPANRREAERVEYLAPEFFWDNEGNAATDVYSLGLMLYAACSGGYLPFQPKGGLLTAKDRSGALRKRMKGEAVVPPSGVTPELAAVIRKALAYEPEDRYISAAELLTALGETTEALPVPTEAPAAPEPPADEPEAAVTEGPDSDEAEDAGEPAPEAVLEETPEAPAGKELFTSDPAREDHTEPELETPDTASETETAPEPDGGAEAPAPAAPKYSVQKDFEKHRTARASVPSDNRKRRASPLIPILCVAAVVVIAAVALLLRDKPQTVSPDAALTYTIEPTLATRPPEPISVTPSLGDDEPAAGETEPAEPTPPAEPEEEEEPAEEEPAEGAPVGSAMIDGLAVEPAGDIVEIADTGANLRTGPGTNYAVAASLPRGAELTRTGTVNGWSQVWYNGNEFYIASNLITVRDAEPLESAAPEKPTEYGSASSAAGSVGTLVVTADVNIRSGPGTGYDKLGEAKTGTTLSAVGRSDDQKWYLVQVNGIEGYVNRKLVSVRDYAEISSLSGTLEVTGEVNVRSGPDVGYDILGVASPGDTLTVTGRTDTGWYRVSYHGATGFMAAEYGSLK